MAQPVVHLNLGFYVLNLSLFVPFYVIDHYIALILSWIEGNSWAGFLGAQEFLVGLGPGPLQALISPHDATWHLFGVLGGWGFWVLYISPS